MRTVALAITTLSVAAHADVIAQMAAPSTVGADGEFVDNRAVRQRSQGKCQS